MIYPSIEELSKNNKFNRYMICIATAKCARAVTQENLIKYPALSKDASEAEKNARKALGEEKAVRTAINLLHTDAFTIHVNEPTVIEGETESVEQTEENA